MLELTVALGGGLLAGLAAEPSALWPLAWIGLVPLWVLSATPRASRRQQIAVAVAWGAGYHGCVLFWITGVHPLTWMGIPWLASLAIAAFCWLFITAWGAALVTAWSLVFATIAPRLVAWERILVGVTLWCGLEWLWSLLPLWWSSLALTQSPNNLAILQWLQLSGPTTVVAAIVAVNGALGEWWRSRRWGWLGAAVGMAIVLHVGGMGLLARPLNDDSNAALQVGIIQGNIPNEIKLSTKGYLKAISGYARGYETLVDRGVEAVLTPETALPFQWSEALEFARVQRERRVPAWVGAFGEAADGRYTNSLFGLSADGRTLARFDKVKLVPLGEYIPFENILGRFISRLSPLEARLAPGDRDQTFETPFGRAIAAICYESAFSSHFRRQSARGGEFILSAANNAHYSAAMPAQHHAQDVLRAIETDRWAVRATNTGYSAIVDPRGRTQWQSGLNVYAIHAGTIYRRQSQSLYSSGGDWLLVLLFATAIGQMHFVTKRLSVLKSQDLMS